MSEALRHGFEKLLEGWPELAAFTGSEPRTGSLSPLAPDLAQDRIRALAGLAALADDPHDAAVLGAQAALFGWLFDSRRWQANPDVLGDLSALLVRQALQAEADRAEADRLNGWLAGLDAVLRPGRAGRGRPDPDSLALAIDAARGLLDQLGGLRLLAAPRAIEAARAATRDHLAWLESLAPGLALPPLGPEGCAQLLALRGIREPPGALVDSFDAEIARCRSLLGPGLLQRRREVRARHPPSFAAALAALSRCIGEARDHWTSQGFPIGERGSAVIVRETPNALRPSIPWGAVFTPRPLRPDEPALVLLTAPDDLAERCDAHLANLAVHEGFPGHLLQAELANAADRPWRAVDLCPIAGLGAGLFACELMEGWAHHAEERMAELGFHADPNRTFMQQDEALWRAVRARVDLGLSLGELGVAAAVERLVEQAGLPEAMAQAEIADYRLAPTYGLSYLHGKLALRRLRRAWPGAEEALYRRLLGEGLVPLAMLEAWAGP